MGFETQELPAWVQAAISEDVPVHVSPFPRTVHEVVWVVAHLIDVVSPDRTIFGAALKVPVGLEARQILTPGEQY